MTKGAMNDDEKYNLAIEQADEQMGRDYDGKLVAYREYWDNKAPAEEQLKREIIACAGSDAELLEQLKQQGIDWRSEWADDNFFIQNFYAPEPEALVTANEVRRTGGKLSQPQIDAGLQRSWIVDNDPTIKKMGEIMARG